MGKQRRHTAVVFVHGQGDQSPMDDLLQLAYTVWETDPKAAAAGQLGNLISVPVETADDGDIRRLITDRVHGRQFHFYQFYWAHLMQGNAVVDVWRWLIKLLQRSKVEIPPTLWRARTILRVIVGAMATFAVVMSALAAARLLAPYDAYGAIAANAYAALWALAAAGVLGFALRGRHAVGELVSLSASVIVVGVLFGAALTSLVAGSERILKDHTVSTRDMDLPPAYRRVLDPLADGVVSVTCALDSNPELSRLRDFCVRRAAGLPAITGDKAFETTWWHVAAAAHRSVIGAALFAAAALALVWGFASPFLKNVMADSARYFSNEPHNVAQRDKVRAKGVELLQRLHRSGQYDRIVVVAHSLGTVVAYGMLDHYWGLVSGHLKPADKQALGEAEDAARDLDHAADADIAERRADYRWAQRKLSRSFADSVEARTAWVVSDFITLGSPLTYAPLLMADSQGEFIAKMRKLFRLPATPPIPVETVTEGYRTDYNFHGEWIGRATGRPDTPWPSAMFLATRWTNLFFTNNRLTKGDIVGGPVCPNFGRGVLDIPIERRILGDGFLHNEYWKWPGQTKTSAWAPAGDTRAYTRPPYHIARLRQAMNLFESDELENQLTDANFRA